MVENTLYYGDNLRILQDHIATESVDLIYLDPPFKSNQTYNVLFQEKNGSASAAATETFQDSGRGAFLRSGLGSDEEGVRFGAFQ